MDTLLLAYFIKYINGIEPGIVDIIKKLFYGQVLKLNNEHKKFIIPNLNLDLYTEYLSRKANTLDINCYIEMEKI